NDADLFDLLGTWVPEPQLRKQVLSTNPARLYQF
ncbi:MAG: hypothetical protein RIS77_1283, partial [Pseudomonadota bacterium]